MPGDGNEVPSIKNAMCTRQKKGNTNSMNPMRLKYPRLYKVIQEAVGELYYEGLGLGTVVRAINRRSLRQAERKYGDPVEVSYKFRGLPPARTIEPCQIEWELKRLVQIVRTEAPKVICEIGTDHGGTLYCWAKAAAPDALVISIDLPRLYRKTLNRFFRSFVSAGQTIHFVRANSQDDACLAEVKRILDGRKIDFLFIDGDHSYEGVKSDFLMYSKLVRDGGLIALHDIVEHSMDRNRCDVERFWHELKPLHACTELIARPGQDCGGIGLVTYRE
ncbi:MAG: class I SAM-dependent methyltransferase [Desulfomonilaceae bacterium]|nr:class I SAM-dependent methyltransferase [Desulfomonilaceae bacterium]